MPEERGSLIINMTQGTQDEKESCFCHSLGGWKDDTAWPWFPHIKEMI